MEKYKIIFHPKVRDVDVPKLGSIAKKLLLVIFKKLTLHPEMYSLPLRSPLKGLWKLRIGDYRVIYKISVSDVKVEVIGHRKEVYEIAKKRLGI